MAQIRETGFGKNIETDALPNHYPISDALLTLMVYISAFCVGLHSALTTPTTKQKVRIMRSTFKTVFYVNANKEKKGIVPIMGRVTINGTIAQFSCKQTIPKALGNAKLPVACSEVAYPADGVRRTEHGQKHVPQLPESHF